MRLSMRVFMRSASAICIVLLPAVLSAQSVSRLPLRPATSTLDVEFLGVTSVREIADGRVIVTDGKAQQLFLADFSARRAALLGRKGRGPRERLWVGKIQPLAGDSSLLDDMNNRRFLLFHGAAIVDVVPPDHPAVLATRAILAGSDSVGHLMNLSGPPSKAGTQLITRADSLAVVLINRRTGRLDTVARVRERPHRRDVEMDAQGRVTRSMFSATEPNAQGEDAQLFPDGWLAIVRLEPRRVDWRSPTGAWTRGAPFPLRPAPLDARARRSIEAQRAEAMAEAKRYRLPAPRATSFPTTLPVLETYAVPKTASDGRLLLRRSRSTPDDPIRYLVVNRRGTIDGEIVLGAHEDIVGFGPRTVYVTVTDEDDIQLLRRHPWP